MDKVLIYTDGSCRNKTGDCGSYAVVMIYRSKTNNLDNTKEFSFGAYKNTTSARMELRGVIAGLRAITKKSIKVELYTDNQYVCNAIAKGWIYKWEKEGWYNRTNADLLRELLFEYRQFPDGNVKFMWIRGHNGNIYNERADELAAIAAKSKNITYCRLNSYHL
jgi:ribonuclease HI